MKLTYDPRYNVAYLSFQEKIAQVETIRVNESFAVDIGADGSVYGVELLNANEQLRGDNGGNFVVVNEVTGDTREISLGV
ncbi:MAG: DUF2283 domain-containing protein [Chthoniobacterales bacterium]|nr:DUF2283 domain-containing protein [Chthoniobacterales bacterium]